MKIICYDRQGKRVDTSIDVGISYVMSSVSSSRKRRQADSQEEAKTTEEPQQTTELGTRDEKAFAISLLDNIDTTATSGSLGEYGTGSVPIHKMSQIRKSHYFCVFRTRICLIRIHY
jgi:hypothetical protein